MFRKAMTEALGKDPALLFTYRKSLREDGVRTLAAGSLVAVLLCVVSAVFYKGNLSDSVLWIVSVSACAAAFMYFFIVKPETDYVFYGILREKGLVDDRDAVAAEREFRQTASWNPALLLFRALGSLCGSGKK